MFENICTHQTEIQSSKFDAGAKLFWQGLDNDPYFAILTLSIYFFGVDLLELYTHLQHQKLLLIHSYQEPKNT